MAENNEKFSFNPMAAVFMAISLIVGAGIGGGVVLLLKSGSKVSIAAGSGLGVIDLFPAKASEVGDNWVVKIDDYAVTKSEYEDGVKEAFKLYKAQYDQLPAEQKAQIPMPEENAFKKQYMDLLLNQYIVTLKAFSDGVFSSKSSQILLKSSIRQALIQLYMQQKVTDQSIFIPSKVEIDQYYKQNKAQFDSTGASATQIKEYINQTLSRQKLQEWQAQFLAQSKEGVKVIRNPSLSQGQGSTMQSPTSGLIPLTNK